MVLMLSSKEDEKSAVEWMCQIGVRSKWLKTMGLLPHPTINKVIRKRVREHFLNPCSSILRRRTCNQNLDTTKGEILFMKHDWSTIPEILLVMILNKLTRLHDRVQLGAVCKWWQCVFRHTRPTQALPSQLPMLMIPHHQIPNKISFFSPFVRGTQLGRRFYHSDMHIPSNSRCVGSTEGWLIYEERKGLSTSIVLLNPFLSDENQIHLPSHSHHMRKPILTKLVLSAGSSASNYVAMAFFCGSGSLTFCRSGDEAWTILSTLLEQHDILYYKQQFYTVDHYTDVKVWDFSTPHPVGTLLAVAPPNFFDFNFWKRYIVEASGDLLLIYRRVKINDFSESPTFDFRIYKMDPLKRVWIEVKTLDGHTLFLGGISSMSVLASNFAGYCNPNCIYFGYDTFPRLGWDSRILTAQRANGRSERPAPFAASLDSVVFSLEDGSFQRLIPSACKHSPIWIEPKLQAS